MNTDEDLARFRSVSPECADPVRVMRRLGIYRATTTNNPIGEILNNLGISDHRERTIVAGALMDCDAEAVNILAAAVRGVAR